MREICSQLIVTNLHDAVEHPIFAAKRECCDTYPWILGHQVLQEVLIAGHRPAAQQPSAARGRERRQAKLFGEAAFGFASTSFGQVSVHITHQQCSCNTSSHRANHHSPAPHPARQLPAPGELAAVDAAGHHRKGLAMSDCQVNNELCTHPMGGCDVGDGRATGPSQ